MKKYRKVEVFYMPKFIEAIKLSNKVSKALKLFNFEATSFPGKIVQKFYPNFLAECAEYISHPRFAVTGTNGKTTTSGILSEILDKKGLKIINNKLGANMPNGIVTALAKGLYGGDGNNVKKMDGVVLECDEAYFSTISNKFVFDYILITNLFRDQLDRYGEMDIARKKIIKGIELNPDIKIILNADDPSLSEITEKLNYNDDKFIYFGFENIEYIDYEKNSNSPKETISCPKCGENILYTKRFYAQLGAWYCSCHNQRKTPDVRANAIVYPDKTILNVTYKNEKFEFKVNLSGLYNAYNALGAIAAALVSGVEPNFIEEALNSYSPVFGRHQKVKLNNGGVMTIHLIKNPVGASEVLRGLKNLKNSRMVIAINDNYADGRDVSWLWDADFESLSDFSNVIYTTGIRSYDMSLRLKYANVNPILIETFDSTDKVTIGIEAAIEELNENEDLVVLTTYTGLLEVNKNINKLIKKYGAN